MALTKASKRHKCKRGHTINKGDQYYPQRRNKSLCWDCGQPVNLLLRWAFNQVRASNER